jgi:hypothetical protein
MTKNQFLNAVTNGGADIVKKIMGLLKQTHTDYCVIGGLAVNAYAEPVVSLDLDIVIIDENIETFLKKAEPEFKIENFPHSINLTAKASDLRIQLQTDNRYQEFITRAVSTNVLGQQMKVASLQDVLQGKLWAYADERRRKSKRQKDLADIYRLIEAHPHLRKKLPPSIE